MPGREACSWRCGAQAGSPGAERRSRSRRAEEAAAAEVEEASEQNRATRMSDKSLIRRQKDN